MKLLFSGGHLTPALAMIDVAHQHGDDVVFVGRTHSQSHQQSHEESEVMARGVRFIPFSSSKLAAWQPVAIFKQLHQFFSALLNARKILTNEKPHVFVSFGGYLAVPLAVAAWSLRIPIVTHEQTRTAGIANRIIAFFATQVAVSFPETKRFFAAKKTIVTGNPIRAAIFEEDLPQPTWYHFSSLPLLYITGGSQGSKAINDVVAAVLPTLTREWFVIHACGKNYREELETLQQKLPQHQQSNYYVREWFSEMELGWMYQHASCIVTRAGANTVAEITRAGRPAIFIPLPSARHNEQYQNAVAPQKAGAAEILPQSALTSERFLQVIHDFVQHHSALLRGAQTYQRTVEPHADQRLYQVISTAAHAT